VTAALPRIGMRLHGGLHPRRCVELAVLAETHGFSSLWFAENPFARGALPAASACAAATRRLRVGVGVVNPYNRHPTLIAMEFGALDELAQGRALMGIGSGIGAAVRQMGVSLGPAAHGGTRGDRYNPRAAARRDRQPRGQGVLG